MALPTKKNLGQLRADLRDRLGQAVGSNSNSGLLNGFLYDSQVIIFRRLPDSERTTRDDSIVSQAGQEKYDWPDTIDPDKTLEIWVEDTGETDNNMYPMNEGIERWMYGQMQSVDYARPRRYERRKQLEVWPLPEDNSYKIHIEGRLRLGAFTVDSDLVTVDQELVLNLALALAKAHYRHPDAGGRAELSALLFNRQKSDNIGHERFVRPSGRRRTGSKDLYDDNRMIHKNTLDI